MPVIVRNRPDGSKEVINSPSVLIKDQKTGKTKKAPTTTTIIPAEDNIISVKAPAIEAMQKGNERGMANPSTFEASSPRNETESGSLALVGTLLVKAFQFITRSGTSKASAPAPKSSSLRGTQQEEIRIKDDLVSPKLEEIVNASPKELAEMANMDKTAEYIKIDQLTNTTQSSKKNTDLASIGGVKAIKKDLDSAKKGPGKNKGGKKNTQRLLKKKVNKIKNIGREL